MPISVSCDCGKSYKVADDKAGKKFKCKDCGGLVAVPQDEVDFGDLGDDWEAEEPEEPEEELPPTRRARNGSSRSKKGSSRKKSGGLNVVVLLVALLGFGLVAAGGVLAYKLIRNAVGAVDPTTYVPEDAAIFVLMRPQRMMKSPVISGLPQDVLDEHFKNGQQQAVSSLDVRKIEYVVVAGSPKQRGAFGAGPLESGVFLVRATEPIDATKFTEVKPGVAAPTEQTHNGRKYWKQTVPQQTVPQQTVPQQTVPQQTVPQQIVPQASVSPPPVASLDPQGTAPPPPAATAPPAATTPPATTTTPPSGAGAQSIAFTLLDDRTILGADEATLLKLLDKAPGPGAMKTKLRSVDLDRDVVFVALPANLPGSEQMSLSGPATGQPAPGTTMKDFKSVVVSADLSGSTLLSVALETSDPDAATRGEAALKDGIQKIEPLFTIMTAEFRNPTATQGQKDLVEFIDQLKAGIVVGHSGREVTLTIKNPGGWDKLVNPIKDAMTKNRSPSSGTR